MARQSIPRGQLARTAMAVDRNESTRGPGVMSRLCIVMLSLAGVVPMTAVAKSVSSPADLGPSDYWAYIEATKGALARAESRAATPMSVVLPDPTLGGVGVTGQLIASNNVTAAGPSTTVNAQLSYNGALAFDMEIDLRSLATFDLAAFGPAGPAANVRVVGSGIGGVTGNFFGPVGQASASTFGFVTIYETNASGAASTIVRTFEVRGSFTDTPIDDVVMLNRNELYKVIVRSTADIRLLNVDNVNLSAYMIMDPLFSSETDGVDVFVSAGAMPVPLPGTAWLLGAGLMMVGARTRTRRHARAAAP
jgi:hypothetical protein